MWRWWLGRSFAGLCACCAFGFLGEFVWAWGVCDGVCCGVCLFHGAEAGEGDEGHEEGLHGLAAFVAEFAACACAGLVVVVDGQDAEGDGGLVLEGAVDQAVCDGVGEDLVVACLAFDDAAEADDAGVSVAGGGGVGDGYELEGAGGVEDVEVYAVAAGGEVLLDCAGQECVGDRGVVPADDDGDGGEVDGRVFGHGGSVVESGEW